MAEVIRHNPRMADDQPIAVDPAIDQAVTQAPSPEDQAIADAKLFIEQETDKLTKIMGVAGVSIRVGKRWTTDLQTGLVTVDPTFFIEQGYNPDWVNYAMMHEIAAHLLPMIKEPSATKERLDWSHEERARHIFLNILEDVAGNRRIHSLLPRQKEVAAQVYSEKLFPSDDLTSSPRHLQLLYKIIREAMIPGSQNTVAPEVDAALDELRNGEFGDIIELSTARLRPGTNEEISREMQFRLWVKYIYPKFVELLEMDKQDDRFKDKPDGEGDPGEPGESGGEGNFDPFYDDYEQNKHPDPMSHEETEEALDDAFKNQKRKEKEARENTPQKQAEKKAIERIESEIGNHSFTEFWVYRRSLTSLASSIGEMSEFFATLLDERVVSTRRLNKVGEEGAVINPNTLAQTVADIRAGRKNPPAFLDYGRTEKERKAEGHFDCYLVVDCSGSMEGDRISQARKATIVFLEGLSAFEREIRAREQQGGIQLDWDVRTSVYTFGVTAKEVKPLSHSLSEAQRLDAHGSLKATGSATNDFYALDQIAESIRNEIARDPASRNRRRIVTVITDGASSDSARLQSSIKALTALGVSVVAIGIQTNSVEGNYPVGRSINDVSRLTKTLSELIETEISK